MAMAAEENKAVIRRLVEEFWNEGNTQVFDDVFADGFIDHTPQPGSDGSDDESAVQPPFVPPVVKSAATADRASSIR